VNVTSLADIVGQQLAAARNAPSRRAAHTMYGGHEDALRQTLIALCEGQELAEHESPGEATLQVLHGRVRLNAGDDGVEVGADDYVAIPPSRHSLTAVEDSAVLLTVVTGSRPPTA
jgi:quercetin dioxygenase-like cupin family protein